MNGEPSYPSREAVLALLAEMVADRDAALLSLDEAEIRAYGLKYGERFASDPAVFWLAVHRARLAIAGFPEEAKQVSRDWLAEHGYDERPTAYSYPAGEIEPHGSVANVSPVIDVGRNRPRFRPPLEVRRRR